MAQSNPNAAEREPLRPDDRTHSERLKDIEFSNQYRIEYIKHLMAIAAGIFALTVTFFKDVLGKPLTAVGYKPVLIGGWLALVISLMAGIGQMRSWASYYVSWGMSSSDTTQVGWRKVVSRRRKRFEYLQIYSFILGLLLLLVFSSRNLYE